jgi:hypothetical protein
VRNLVIIAALIGLLPASAHAQEIQHGVMQSPGIRSELDKKNDAAIDKAYQDTLKRSNGTGQSAKGDPWHTLRPADNDTTKR